MLGQRNGVRRIEQIMSESKEIWDRDTYQKMMEGEYSAVHPNASYCDEKPFELQVESFIINQKCEGLDNVFNIVGQGCRFNDRAEMIVIWQSLTPSVDIYRSLLTAEQCNKSTEFYSSLQLPVNDPIRFMIPVAFTLYREGELNAYSEVMAKGIVCTNDIVVAKFTDEYRTLKIFGSIQDFSSSISVERTRLEMHHIDSEEVTRFTIN